MSEIPHAALLEALQERIGGRRVVAAAFLTFRFDPGFFEREILPVVFDVAASNVAELRLLQLEEKLREERDVAVYYDRRALEATGEPARLNVQRVGVTLNTGYFHPKNVLLLVEEEVERPETVRSTGRGRTASPSFRTRSLIVGCMSANLTRAGYWENVEVAHFEELREREASSLSDDVLRLIDNVKRACRREETHVALDKIRGFVRKSVPQESRRTVGGVLQPRMFGGRESFVEFLNAHLPGAAMRARLEVISPYFDTNEQLAPLHALIDTFRPDEARVLLPRGQAGDAACSRTYYDALSAYAEWGDLPKGLVEPQRGARRTVHAKVYRFTNVGDRREFIFSGSVNLTNAAFDAKKNFESGILVEVELKRKPDWWLGANEHPPLQFASKAEDAELPVGSGWRLALRCTWSGDSVTGRAFWESSEASPPLQLLSHGAPLFELNSLPPREDVLLDGGQNSTLSAVLRSSSFVTVRIAEQGDATILVQEDGMEYKPSVITTFTSAEILRWWSQLTPEQKKAFLEERAELSSDETVLLWLGAKETHQSVDKLFSSFAETYHSFGNLNRTVRSALDENRGREAKERLFGAKFDTLMRLVERITKEEADPATLVDRYVQLLCARQLLKSLERDYPHFIAEHRDDAKRLRAAIATGGALRDDFTFDSPTERDKFFDWFERWFVVEAKPLEEAHAQR